ncbi:MAG: hypothetical protein AAF604_04405 [Acidobacteriota bacterium]
MRKFQLLTLGAILLLAVANQACTVAERLSCGEKPKVDTRHKERLQVRLIVEQHGQTVVDEATIVCRIVGSECIEVGGNWSTKWQKIPREPRALSVDLPGGEVVSIKPPHYCARLISLTKTEEQPINEWNYPRIWSGGMMEPIIGTSAERREILESFQIEHLGLEVNSLN